MLREVWNGSETDNFVNILLNMRDSRPLESTFRNVTVTNPRFHLMRIPKTGSSTLSAVLRRLAGCDPPGACCKYPGNPPGSCPATAERPLQYFCDRILGCTGHNPHYDSFLFSKSRHHILISMMREPVARSLSAFAYHHPHTNCELASCSNRTEAFLEYTQALSFQNPAVKMLSGTFPYRNITTCASFCPFSLRSALHTLPKFDIMGVTEMWDLSMLLLHTKIYMFQVDRSDFTVDSLGSLSQRFHPGDEYKTFISEAREKHFDALQKQNQFDILLYKAVLRHFCDQLHSWGLWTRPAVRRSWAANIPSGYTDEAPRCFVNQTDFIFIFKTANSSKNV